MKPLKTVLISVFFLPVFLTTAYALNLDNLRNYFLNGEYKICVTEGEKILAQAASSKDLEELYYILGLCYLKEGNYLRASDIFEITIQEFRNGKFKEEAKLGLGDTYFARRDYGKAESVYQEILKNNSHSKLKPALYYRLSQLGKRTANSGKEQEYFLKLKSEFPASPEALAGKEFFPETAKALEILSVPKMVNPPEVPEVLSLPASPVIPKSSNPVEEVIISGAYSIQVGAFSSLANAKSLTLKLKAQGYSSYASESSVDNKKIYKARIGGFSSMQEAQSAAKKLRSQGYTVKIIP